jgi:hypothetical protein
VALEEIVPRNKNDFIREASDISLQERDEDFVKKRAALANHERRVFGLDIVIKRLY